MELRGRPIEVRYATGLRDTAGNPAYAATYIPRRLIVLDGELRKNPPEHGRILVHELLHFAWVRLGNPTRRGWEGLLAAEWAACFHGEAGWSAEWRKRELRDRDVERRTRRWREYCCEAYCDTGSWIWTGVGTELTLASQQRRSRMQWFSRWHILPV